MFSVAAALADMNCDFPSRQPGEVTTLHLDGLRWPIEECFSPLSSSQWHECGEGGERERGWVEKNILRGMCKGEGMKAKLDLEFDCIVSGVELNAG